MGRDRKKKTLPQQPSKPIRRKETLVRWTGKRKKKKAKGEVEMAHDQSGEAKAGRNEKSRLVERASIQSKRGNGKDLPYWGQRQKQK